MSRDESLTDLKFGQSVYLIKVAIHPAAVRVKIIYSAAA